MATPIQSELRHGPNGRHHAMVPSRVNVSDGERWVSVLGGGLLGLYGLSRHSPAGLGLAVVGGALMLRGATGRCPCYGALGISTAQKRHGVVTSVAAGNGIKVEQSIIIDRPPEVLFQFWRDLDNLPRFMRHLDSVVTLSPTLSRWTARGPLGTRLWWEAVIINEKPNELIAWRSLGGASVDNAGSVHFRPLIDGQSTLVRVVLKYDPPAGRIGATVAKLLGDNPDRQIQRDLQSFKRLMEARENPTAWSPRTTRRF